MVTAAEARQLRVSKGAVNHETYKEIYGKLSNRIKLAAARGETSLEYRVPPLVPGRPMYDMSHAVRYNADKLRHAGFAVDARDDVLTVDWKPPPAPPKAVAAKKKAAATPAAAAQTPPKNTFVGSGPSTAISKKLQDLRKKLKW